MNVISDAVNWCLNGAIPFPVRNDGSKAPAGPWKQHQGGPPDLKTTIELFQRTATDGLGLICGPGSGELGMIEAEGRAVQKGLVEHFAENFTNHGLEELWTRLNTGYREQTPTGGIHWLYRVGDGPVAPNTRLARNTNREVLFETRGRGGFVVVAPSGGSTHPTGKPWTLQEGGPATVASITVEEQDAIFAMATLLGETPTFETTKPGPVAAEPSLNGSRPGDDYNQRGSWEDLLKSEGWQFVRKIGQTWMLTRPGKHPKDGISATLGHSTDGVTRLYVFSSSTGFQPEVPYTLFGAYALLRHGGDYQAAARTLAEQGYGQAATPQVLTLATPPELAPLNVIELRPPAAITDGSSALQIDPPAPADLMLARYGQTEHGLSLAFVDRYADQVRYCPQRSRWLTWSGARWCWDEKETHREHAKALATGLPDNDTWKAFRRKMLSYSGMVNMVSMARSDPRINVHIDSFDADPWRLNTPSGPVDLRSGKLLAPDPARLDTRTTTVPPEFNQPAPAWTQFLDTTFGGDQDLICYMQTLFGLAALGQVTEQILPFLNGPGANGKSTLIETIMRTFGTGPTGYATAVPSEILMTRTHSEHPAELAQLVGIRLAVATEIEDGQRFAEARIKLLTGSDSINARFMRQDPFTFTPSHTLVLVGNNKPTAASGGPALWRRLRAVPFTHTVPEDQRDSMLADKLWQEAPQILAWIIQGAVNYLTNGLQTPLAVQVATGEYEADQDTIAGFIAECCHLAPGQPLIQVKVSDLKTEYEHWCQDTGSPAVSTRRLTQELRDRFGVTGARDATGSSRIYQGICILKPEPTDDDSSQDKLEWYR